LDESLAIHLFLRPGDCDLSEALRRTEGGLWLGWLSGLACFDRRDLRFRAVAHGVRRIENGALGRALPDLVWEGSLAAVLSSVLGVGREAVVVGSEEPLLGAISAPALAISPLGSFRLAPSS
jgi:predicted Zn-dependent protease